MKIVLSRKRFDTTSGGAPSPIIEGAPFSLPIPTGKYPSVSTYGALGLGDLVSEANSKWTAGTLCHEDPMFWDDKCAFGQTSAAQSHLAKHKVGVGDVFLFFGLFAELGPNDRHHRIFGYLKVEKVLPIGCQPTGEELRGTPRRHPHTIAKWNTDEKWPCNNTIYLGRGMKAKKAHEGLRLTKPGGPRLTLGRSPMATRNPVDLSRKMLALAQRSHASLSQPWTRICHRCPRQTRAKEMARTGAGAH